MISNLGQTIIYDNERLKFNKWNYIVCQADKFFNLTRLNGLEESVYIPVEYNPKMIIGSLSIVDKTTNFNYGFSLVRELKLYSSYNFPFWDDSHYNINPEQFQYLLHYFHNSFNTNKLIETRMIDIVTGLSILLKTKSNRIGYNYVIGHENLVICEEGNIYNEESNTCVSFISENCKVPRNQEDDCLLCSFNKPYLKENDLCYGDCGPKFYNDVYLNQCRKCADICYTCSGKYNNNCTSCTGIFYYIESLHICVPECQEYGLVKSTKIKNTCEELLVESFISEPVYLNNSYDYNPLNKDYSSKIIPRNLFSKIVGHIKYASSKISTKWIYNWEETLEINKPYRLFKASEIPDDNPIINNNLNELSISVKNDYFKDGYKYVFDLQITSTSGSYVLNLIHRYIIMMNNYPDLGPINILPKKGYKTNKFLITINQCKDDLSNKDHLQYKFSYFTKKENIQKGNMEPSPEEILIQDWSRNSEALYQFQEINPFEENKFYIRGYCMDEFGLYYSDIQEVEVYDIPTGSNIELPLHEVIESIDINEELTLEQLLKRAEFLASVTLDYGKNVEILNRTNVTDFNKKGLWQEKLILFDPTSSKRDIYCNFRGDSYVIYHYLFCECYEHNGTICQIDHPSYNYVIDIYNKLLYKTKLMQTRKFNIELIKTIDLLMKSAASFMSVDNMNFFLDSIDIINSHMNLFATDLLKGDNYVIYFNIYNSIIEYGLSLVNKFKYKNFVDNNIRNIENLYNVDKMRNATLSNKNVKIIKDYFYEVKFGIQNLLEFYTLNKKEFRFINNNINIYVLLVDENFPLDTYFSFEKKIYEPYMDFKKCLEKNMNKGDENDPSYRVYFSSIVWKVSTYMYEKDLYWDTISPTISFKFIDYDTGEKIDLSNCGNTENQIKLFFPIKDYKLIEIINLKREFLSPENQYSLEDDIYCDPVYINKSGAVINISPEERRAKYFLGFNFSCQHYNTLEEDKDNIILSSDSLEYYRFTKDNYVQCLLNKLMQKSYDEYVVNFYSITPDFHLNSRLFYLKHYNLLLWHDNYKDNFAFYYHIIIVVLYILLSIIYIYIEKLYHSKMQTLSLLKSEIAKMNLPYKDEYLFDTDILIKEDIKSKLTGKRKPNIEEMNLDINNLNIGIMADEISKYKRGFKSKEIKNTFNYNTNYFGIKDDNKKNINKKYFSENNDVPFDIIDKNDDDITPEQFNKMKNFYQAGFKGLDKNEMNKKEIQLSDDNKNVIVINKKQNLDKIMEINEDEDEEEDDIEIKAVNFFDKKNDIDNIEQETNIRKLGNKKKIAKNLSKYKDYLSSNDDIDSTSKLRDSKRETTKTKFFNSNPPRKERININSDKYIFNEKDQKKIGKSNSIFFTTGSEGLTPNQKKAKNIFQNDVENIYKPKFRGPKIIGENSDFYNYETEFFEQNKDTEYKNQLYFGSLPPKEKIQKDQDLDNEKPKMKIGFYYKNSQIDFKSNEEKLPKLAENLTFEQKMEEFHNISISLKGFIIRNITSRYILLTTFAKMNIFYKRYMRAGKFSYSIIYVCFFLINIILL